MAKSAGLFMHCGIVDAMNLKQTILSLAGILLALLGALWLLQGAGLLTICPPLLCFADCECITGASLGWAVAGAAALIAGAALAGANLLRHKKAKS